MAVREILLLGNPLLWEVAKPVTDTRDPSVAELIDDLASTLADFRMRNHFGRAIAAPQIGRNSRAIFLNAQQPIPIINPTIIASSSETMELWDDCFSFPELMVRVRRQREIVIRYQDLTGTERMLKADGDLSELLQHEIDHLDGILAVDRAIDRRSFALRSEIKKLQQSV